ncbi:DUF5060 domain-containing protein [Lewinella sp. IMCC34183]|uniref:DUF5060 domain-containing protein n=1 Tax=Lewinella sp. IMCC34183 TaxID=2248762 RepID=UPI0018E554EA|nr:DUF5060 domain-containing protein [Lewinella sp. IMCC34183]
MRQFVTFLLLLTLCPLLPLSSQSGPAIDSVVAATVLVDRHGKFEAAVYTPARYANPFDYDEVRVRATFSGPSGQVVEVDGYYYQPFALDPRTGTLTSTAATGNFGVRFSPNATGRWTYAVTLTDATGSSPPVAGAFECRRSADPRNRGFVRRNETNYLNFDDGRQYIPIGENIAWPQAKVVPDYRKWIDGVTDNGGNFLRLWNAYWGLGLEWLAGYDGFGGLRRYKQANARYQDWLYDYAAERGLYVMLCLQYHGQVSTQVNPAWATNPYNAANGGPLGTTREFFTDSTAIAHTKNRFRYIVARWGYSRNIMAWELFNEVGWTDGYEEIQDDVAAWHAEMARYLKEIDPYGHLVTTSFADESHGAAEWADPNIDLTQTHFYVNNGNIERALVGGVRRYLDDYGRPTLVGEFGLGAERDLVATDPEGVYVHNSLWAGLFGGGAGTAMSWWWDNYVHPRNLYRYFRGIAAVSASIPFLEGDMAPTPTYVAGAPGDLILTPTLGWASVADDTVRVAPDRQITPRLSYFLYGTTYNTAYRSPPTFVTDFPVAADVTVTTGGESGTFPRLSISVDGEERLRSAALPNTAYTVRVPAGRHRITVDNPGTDWISIRSYTIGGVGSRVDAYILSTIDGRTAAGWVFNHRYNHEFLAENGGPPDPVAGSVVVVPNMLPGSYLVNWYDCLTGQVVDSAPAVADAGGLVFSVPDFTWDLAFRISASPATAVSAARPAGPYAVRFYPNPAAPAGLVRLELPPPDRAEVRLYDRAGRLQAYYRDVTGDRGFRLPQTLLPGTYWVSVEQSGMRVTAPLQVNR